MCEVRRLISHLATHGGGLVSAGKCLTEWGRLNDALVCKLLGGRGNNGQSGGWPLLGRGSRRLAKRVAHLRRFLALWTITLGGFQQSRFNDRSLLFSDRQAAVNMLPHGGVLRLEAGREDSHASLLQADSISCRQRGG